MASDGQVVFEITADGKHVTASIKEITKAIESEGKKWDQAAKKGTGGIEDAFMGMVKKVTAGLTAAKIGQILLDWGKAAIDAASDLQEVQNVVDTVFGDGAKKIDAWAQKASEKFGLTETMAKRYTSTLGAMMKSSGLAGDEIVDMSTNLAGLAADMASFYNLDFDTAFEKIRSGISGETMPLKQLGINMSVANLNAFALAQGLTKTFDQMTQGEQTMLRYQYLMQATADAQGDFEKTSDGFANARRRMEASLQSIQTSLGKLVIEPFSNATAAVADFLAGIAASMMPEKTVIDEFNEIDADTANKMADLEATYSKAKAIIDLLKDIKEQTVTLNDGSIITFEELFQNMGDIQKSGGDINAYLEGLGLDVDYVIRKYNVWKESTRQLVSLVPSLTNVIDQETGAIEGGTDALEKNLDEWKAYQEKKIAWAAYYAKKRALEEKKAELYMYEFDAGAARKAAENAADKLTKLYKAQFDEKGRVLLDTVIVPDEQQDQALADITEYNALLTQRDKTAKELAQHTRDFTAAEEWLANGLQALIEKYGDEEDAMKGVSDATGELTDDMTLLQRATAGDADAAKKLAGSWQETADALKAVGDYYENVLQSTEQSVNSTIKGFEKITKAADDARESIRKKDAELAAAKMKYSNLLTGENSFEKIAAMDAAAFAKLPPKVQEAYNEIAKLKNEQDKLNESVRQYEPETMLSNLNKQIEYMDEYTKNLEKLKEWGVSDAMLAHLSDGSAESAEYLAGLVGDESEDAKKAAMEVGEKFEEVEQRKQKFASDLTDTKLVADQAYQKLLDTAQTALDDLNMYDEAYDSLTETCNGIADGIEESLPEVHAAVNLVIAELDRLAGYGVEYGFDGSGGIAYSYRNAPHFAGGTDWVPANNYPAFLDYGEAVLTAEENQIWQRFKNGQQPGIDYSTLGGLMRDNVQAGGNVYLDGRTVGRVISDMQGNQYRTMQRSGWQS